MSYSIEKYKRDIADLIDRGAKLLHAMEYECDPIGFRKSHKSQEEFDEYVRSLPSFKLEYQSWYSEARLVLNQLLPDRLADFIRYYEPQEGRKLLSFESYRIADYIIGLIRKSGQQVIVNTSAAIPRMKQQLAIVIALESRFESSLFDIRLHLQAEMFDDELDAAKYLLDNNFVRGAGALAGVVLERHLKQVCSSRSVAIAKKQTISKINDALRDNKIINPTEWRLIQLLGDYRNSCDHSHDEEPTKTDVDSLIEGVNKIIKTVMISQ